MAWLTGYTYRKKITITGQTGAGTNYQVKLQIGNSSGGNLNLSGHAQSFPNDIRFTSSDGSTQLYYWIENVVSTPITVWVKVIDSLESNIDIYCYYGKASDTTTSNGTNTFIRVIGSITEQPVKGAWNLDGNALDTSGNNNNATLNGGMGYTTGKFGQAGQFDGVDDYINLPNSILSTSGSISLWFKTNSTAGIRYIYVFDNTDSPEIRIMIPSGNLSFIGYDNVAYQWNIGTSFTDTTSWHHVVGTFANNDVKFYLDNVLIGTDTSSSITHTTSSQHRLGYYSRSGNYFNGLIDQVKIYNRVLTQSEITDIYNNYGYTTTNYPGRELVSKYTSPEPTFSATGTEEILATPANITATSLTITPSASPCIVGCTVRVDVIWTNTGGTSGTFTPKINVGTNPVVVYSASDQTVGPSLTASQQFIISGMTTGTYTICPDPN